MPVNKFELEENVTITKRQYDELVRDAFKLECLEAGGVDNWAWYHESLKQGGFFDDEDDE